MPTNPLAAQPPWRQLLIVSLTLPIFVAAVVLAFAWPSARLAPRDLPVGIVGSGASAEHVVASLEHQQSGAFDAHAYADPAAARTAIHHRDVYGAFVVTPGRVTVLEAVAASPTVAQLLGKVGNGLAHAEHGPTARADVQDVVPTPSSDPRGVAFGASLLPLCLSGSTIAAVIALMLRWRPAYRQVLALGVVSITGGLGAYLIAQTFLGVLPGATLATWGGLSLTILALSTTMAGLTSLLGPSGMGIGVLLLVFVGNAFSGATSAPDLQPTAIERIGRALPPGAAANLLRSVVYFDGHGASAPLAVLIA